MKKSIFDFIYILIAFTNFVGLIQGQIHINGGYIRGLTPIYETMITIPSSEYENEKNLSYENDNFSSDIKTSESTITAGIIDNIKNTKSEVSISSSFHNDISNNIISDTRNEEESTTFNAKTTEIESTKDDTSIPTYINSISENSISTDYNILESSPSSEKENISNFKTTVYVLETDKEDSSNSTNKILSTNENTYLNFNNSVNLSTLLITSTNQLSNEKIPTTIIKINNSAIIKTTEIIYKDTSLILLGFSHYNKLDSYFSFYTYFGVLEGSIYSITLKIPVEITYNTNLRFLQNNEANCTLKDKLNQKISYLCEVQTETKNINNIKIIPEFNFVSQTSYIVISPFANNYINNIQNVQNNSILILTYIY